VITEDAIIGDPALIYNIEATSSARSGDVGTSTPIGTARKLMVWQDGLRRED